MKKLGVIVLLFAALVQMGFGQDQKRNHGLKKPSAFDKALVSMQKATLAFEYLTLWSYSEGGMVRLNEDTGRYPYAGIGAKLEGKSLGGWRAYVESVWIGSPAERVGLRKGDRILELNGERVCMLPDPEAKKVKDSCAASVASEIKDSPGPVNLLIQRGKKRFSVTLAKEIIGVEVLVFVRSHRKEWEAQIKKNKEILRSFNGMVTAAGDDPSKLDKLIDELDGIEKPIFRPWEEFVDFIETRWHE
ncbi:MAG: PDZ domain-containing protein [bacterium]|nr:PDZ domain-containing protein [bacterium]